MPNTIADNLHRLKATVPAIRNSITAKGGTVGATDGLEEFAADIMSIKNDLTSIDITENGTYYSGDETVVTSSTFPVVVNDSNGTPVRHADINGNTVQSETPTSDNPIMPQGTGERTGNLLDRTAFTGVGAKIEQVEDGIRIIAQSGGYAAKITLNISSNTDYYISYMFKNITNGTNRVRVFAGGDVTTEIASFVSNTGGTFNTGNNTKINIWFYAAFGTAATVEYTKIMFNSGSTALPYELYGIKIPISSTNTTTPVYLGEVETTRKIRKLVLTGNETVAGSAVTGGWIVTNLSDNINNTVGVQTTYCSHFVAKNNGAMSSLSQGEMCVNTQVNNRINFVTTFATAEDFKTYLQEQYAAGTPVTVWYVLAEPETAVVNEPLMKIGDYADSLSVDVELPLLQNTQNNIDVNTTLKPSSASFTYNKLSEYIGYNEINVDVSNTYTAEDEGKVVNNATLVPQTAMSAEITVNGTYDTTLYNNIVVNVPDIVGHTFIVATIPNAVVTVTNASNTYTETADNVGEALFKSVAAGTYNVTATYDDAVSDTTSITIADHTVTEDSFATLTISASTNTAITVTDGTVTKTLTYTGTPIVQYVSLGTWDLSCVIDDTEITRTVLVNSYTNQNIRLAPPVSRYVDFTTNTTTITGDPNTYPVYMGINRCNVSDNGTINAYYGDASYVEDGSNGQVMVKIPKFYYKVTPDENGGLNGVNIRKCTWEISETPADGFTLHPAFYDANGNEIDYFLYGAFDGVGQRDSTYGTSYNTSTDKLSSVAGSSYLPTNSLTRATARTMATNRGTGWYSAGVKQTMAVLMLFAVEYGFNSQIAVGQGVVSASAATYAGQTTGNITSGTQDNKTTPVNWRGIENLWGNIWDWIDGLNVNERIPYFCNTYTFVDDTSTGYTQISFSLPSSNYITAFGYDSTNDWVLLPSESSSTANPTGPIGDYVSSNSGWRVALLGGRWSDDSSAGAFYWHCSANSSSAGASVGARLMFIPTAA